MDPTLMEGAEAAELAAVQAEFALAKPVLDEVFELLGDMAFASDEEDDSPSGTPDDDGSAGSGCGVDYEAWAAEQQAFEDDSSSIAVSCSHSGLGMQLDMNDPKWHLLRHLSTLVQGGGTPDALARHFIESLRVVTPSRGSEPKLFGTDTELRERALLVLDDFIWTLQSFTDTLRHVRRDFKEEDDRRRAEHARAKGLDVDIKLVVEQTGASEAKAKEALEASNGDIIAAIMMVLPAVGGDSSPAVPEQTTKGWVGGIAAYEASKQKSEGKQSSRPDAWEELFGRREPLRGFDVSNPTSGETYAERIVKAALRLNPFEDLKDLEDGEPTTDSHGEEEAQPRDPFTDLEAIHNRVEQEAAARVAGFIFTPSELDSGQF